VQYNARNKIIFAGVVLLPDVVNPKNKNKEKEK